MLFTKGFRTEGDLLDHFDNHGSEFDARDEADYLEKADIFLGGPKTETMLECIRPSDSATLRFDWRTQKFGVLGNDGYIQTYFIPDPTWHMYSSNRAYFLAECKRRRR